jgi:hypothetical protein
MGNLEGRERGRIKGNIPDSNQHTALGPVLDHMPAVDIHHHRIHLHHYLLLLYHIRSLGPLVDLLLVLLHVLLDLLLVR